MKKILFISHDASLSGAPLVLLEILQILKKTEKYYIKVLFLEGGDMHKDFEFVCDVVIVEKKENTFLKKIRRKIFNKNEIIRKLNNEKFDLLYLNSIASFAFFPELESLKVSKTILHMHESGNFPFYSYKILEKILEKVDKVICVSNLVKNYLLSIIQVDIDKVIVIYPCYFNHYNFLDIDSKTNQVSKDEFVIGGCGNLSLTKGFDLFISVASNFYKKYGKSIAVGFVWLGDNGNKEAKYLFNRDIEKLGLEEKIKIIPKNQKPFNIFKKFDVFLLSSREEAFGLAAFENGLLGNPVLCFEKSSGISELMMSQNTILPYIDIDSVTKLIWEMFNNRVLYNSESEQIKKSFMNILRKDDLMNIEKLISELIF